MPRSSLRFRFGGATVSVQHARSVRRVQDLAEARRLVETVIDEHGARVVHELDEFGHPPSLIPDTPPTWVVAPEPAP